VILFLDLIAQQGLKAKKTDLASGRSPLSGAFLVRDLSASHIRGFPRSTVAAPGPVGGTDLLKVGSFLMHPESWKERPFRPDFF
jgi:hypothetical protein